MKLTEWTSCGGCAAKWGGAPLGQLVRNLAAEADPSLLIGLAPFDDAAVYKLTADTAIVSTTDFFPPLVDDPADFGAVAATNACSDVFAMGGRVIMALNIAAFPEEMPPEVIGEILAAATDTVRRAGGTIAGGHTIRSPEPIFGLAVQGTVHPDRVWSKGGARPGDRLVLSKPIGTGIVLAGGDEAAKRDVISGMRTLNDRAAGCLTALAATSGSSGSPGSAGASAVHAVTDVTGFGLAGHSWEMAERSGVTVRLDASAVPCYQTARDLAEKGVKTGGESRNRAYLGEQLLSGADPALEALLLDPQTSGGLLAAVDPSCVPSLVGEGWWEIGEVADGPATVRIS